MSAFTISIDGKPVEVAPGRTVLQAARQIGLDIPTLCHLEKCGPLTSCQVCLVKVAANGQGRLVPSCATLAVPGMVIESESEEVHEARRTALELLFSDHVGDCLSPCHRLCPLQLNIPAMIRQIKPAAWTRRWPPCARRCPWRVCWAAFATILANKAAAAGISMNRRRCARWNDS